MRVNEFNVLICMLHKFLTHSIRDSLCSLPRLMNSICIHSLYKEVQISRDISGEEVLHKGAPIIGLILFCFCGLGLMSKYTTLPLFYQSCCSIWANIWGRVNHSLYLRLCQFPFARNEKTLVAQMLVTYCVFPPWDYGWVTWVCSPHCSLLSGYQTHPQMRLCEQEMGSVCKRENRRYKRTSSTGKSKGVFVCDLDC